MPSQARAISFDDSDSLTSMATTADSSVSSDEGRVQSTKTSTPATSVLGEEKRLISTRKRTRSGKHTSAHQSDSDSQLSELEESHLEALGSASAPAKKKLKGSTDAGSSTSSTTANTPNGRASISSATLNAANLATSRSSSSSAAPATANSSSRASRNRRAKSPEVVVYVNKSGSSSSAASKSANNNPSKGKSALASSSSPITRDAIAAKKEESDSEETEDDIPFRKDDKSSSKKLTKRAGKARAAFIDSDDEDDFVPSADEDEEGNGNKAKIEEEDIITASRLLARQVAQNITDKLASSPTTKLDKGKGKASTVTTSTKKQLVVSTKKTTAISRKSLDKLKKEVISGSDKKGKGKKIQSSDEEGDEDFEIDSQASDDAEDSEITDASSSDLSDIEGDDGKEKTTTHRPRGRNNAAKKAKASGKKLTWWQKNDLALQKHHHELRHVWDDLRTVEVVKPVEAAQPTGLTMKMLPFQLEGLYWLLQQEKGPWRGGLLADEMGMGKTIQMISLVMSDFDPNEKNRKHTLVLAPTVAIMQWRNEFNKFTSGMKVCVWHGGNRTNDMKELGKYDVILTSYAVLESSFRRQNTGYKRKGELIKEDSVLHSIDWHRVILDEAHNIKDRSCNTARGAFALKANYRWCLSGTPLQNRVGELYSLIRFIGVDPFAYYYCKKCPCKALHWRFSNRRTCDECGHTPMHHICYWNNEILKPIQKYGAMKGTHGHDAFEKLSLLLARMMLRRTKVERADDMGLPPRAVMVRRDYFTEEEEEFYTSLYSDVKRTFSTYVAQDSLLNNYANVFQLLTRMRQTACHPDMVLKGAAAKALLGENASKAALSISTCRLCLDEGDDPVMSKCRHVFCRECIRQYLETAIEYEPECPVCHLPLTIDLNQETEQELLDARQGMLSKIDPGKWRTSTKIEALVEELSKLKTEDHSIKSLVFSQFTSFLDLIARRLQLAGFKIARLQGNMTPEARDRTVKYFMNTTDCTVFLLSLKAGGVALNLTEASRVFIMDPWWNPAAELQAADRIHRLGQHRPVIVKRLIIENSIESKIVELQKKKEHMSGAVLGDDQALGRLTPEDLSFLFTM